MIPKYEQHILPCELAGALRVHLGISAPARVQHLPQAAAFLRSKQLATLWSGTELPSLYEVAGGELAPRMALVSSPATGNAWAWAKSLVESEKFVLVRLFRRRATLVARPLWSALVELVPGDIAAAWRLGQFSTAAYQIASFLDQEGPTSTRALQEALPRRFPILPISWKRGLRELEEKLVIFPLRLAYAHDGKASNTWELLRRALAGKEPPLDPGGASPGIARLVEAAVRASGVVDACECGRWFPHWNKECREALGTLKATGKIGEADNSRPSYLAWAGLTESVTTAA